MVRFTNINMRLWEIQSKEEYVYKYLQAEMSTLNLWNGNKTLSTKPEKTILLA